MDKKKLAAARSLVNFYNGNPPNDVVMAQLKVNEAEAKELLEYVRNPPKRGRPPKKKKEEKVVVTEKKSEQKPEQKQKVNKLIYTLRWPMLICAMIAFVLSCIITVSELAKRQPLAIAVPMGIAFIGFGLCSSEMGFFYKKTKRPGLAFAFIAIWVMIVAYSINNTTSSFYDRWRERSMAQDNVAAQTITNQALFESYEKQEKEKDTLIADKRKRLAIFQATLDKYVDPELKRGAEYNNATWGAISLEKEIKALDTDRTLIIEKKQKLLESHTDIKKDTGLTRVSTYYSFVSKIFKGLSADLLQFIIDLLPALVLDLISSMALYVFLFVKEEKA